MQTVNSLWGAFALHPDGGTLAIPGPDGSIQLRRTLTGELLRTLDAHIEELHTLSFSADGQRLTALCRKSLTQCDVESDGEPQTIELAENPGRTRAQGA